MDPWIFLQAAAIGFSIAAPVGPIGLLCIERTLAQGMPGGLAIGLGAATADALYGAAAAFGLGLIAALADLGLAPRLAGAALLCGLGIRTVATAASEAAGPARLSAASLFGAYAASVGLTLANPATVLSFVAIFAGLGLSEERRGAGDAVTMIAGVFAGSGLWWLILSALTAKLARRIGPRARTAIRRVSGASLIGFGVAIAAAVLV
jgi:threonine/homoserine/homoserine lactone efflux protein